MQSQLVITVLEQKIRRFPQAHLSDDGEWVVLAGPGEPVLPRGALESGELKPDPVKIRATVSEAYEHLLAISALGDADERGAHLLRHVREYGLSPLCAVHGLPVGHSWPERARPKDAGRTLSGTLPKGASCPIAPVDGSGPARLSVAGAVGMAEGYYAVEDLAFRVRQGMRVTRPILEAVATVLPPGSTTARLALAELDRDGAPLPARSRQLVAGAAESLLRQASTYAGVVWVAYQRPELVMKAFDSWGLYAVELARRLSVDGAPRSVYVCSVCGRPVVLTRRPKDGDQVYCTDPLCRRERERRKKARQRARLAAVMSEAEGTDG